MQKDQEAERAARPVPPPQPATAATLPTFPPLPPPEPPPPDPHIEALNARWHEFEEQDYEGQIALFRKTLEEKELMDDEMAFDMLDALYMKSIERHDRDRFNALVDALRERLPNVYAQSAGFYLDLQLTNILASGRLEMLPSFTSALAEVTDEQIDTFNRIVAMLAYHGQLEFLVEVMRLAWPQVRESPDIFAWAINEFAKRAQRYLILNYLEHNPAPDAADPALREQLEFYGEVVSERVSQYCTLLTGQLQKHWTMGDFQFQQSRRRARDEFDEDEEAPPLDEARQNLHDLSIEFLGYLRREEDAPYAKGDVGREEIVHYLLDRFDGKLEPRESMLKAALRRKPKSKPTPRPPEHVLCPDRRTLDQYLTGLMTLLNYHPHKAGATLELMPAWLRFLETRQLIDTQQRQKTLTALHGLDADLLKLWGEHPADPVLAEGMKRWRENAEREPPER
jgi:hypothetical protein